jgi:hypothetical protein
MIAANNKSNAKIAAKKSTSNLSRFIIQSSYLHFPAPPEFERRKLGASGGFGKPFGFLQKSAALALIFPNAGSGFETGDRAAKTFGAAFVMPDGDAHELAAAFVVFRNAYQAVRHAGEFALFFGFRRVTVGVLRQSLRQLYILGARFRRKDRELFAEQIQAHFLNHL